MRRRTLWIVIGAVAATTVVGVSAWWFLLRPPGPEVAAREYLAALAAGDAERALSYVDAPDDGVDRVAALAGATELLTDPEVYGVGFPAGTDLAGAAVRFRLGGQPYDTTLSLAPDGTGGWRVRDTGLAVIDASTTLGTRVLVGEAAVDAGMISVLPAVYPVSAAPTSLLAGTAEAVAVPGELATAAVTAELTADAVATVQGELDAYLAECTRASTTVAASCGFRVPWAADLGTLDSLAYRIERAPTLVLAASGGGFEAGGGRLVATASGTAHDGSAASFTYVTDDWTLRGTVGVSDISLRLSVR